MSCGNILCNATFLNENLLWESFFYNQKVGNGQPESFLNIFLLYFFPFSFNLDRGYSTFAPPDASPHEYHLLSAFMAHKAFVCWYCHLLESFLSLSRIAPDSNKAIHNGQMAFSFSNHLWVKNEFRILSKIIISELVCTRPWPLFFQQPSQLKNSLSSTTQYLFYKYKYYCSYKI